MATRKPNDASLNQLLGGLTELLEKLGELAEKGQELRREGELRSNSGVRGMYGFTIRTGSGRGESVKVEPFGNVRSDRRTGEPVVAETIEPPVDLFEESDHVLVLVEVPGVGAENVLLELINDRLRITADAGRRKYRKELTLPRAFRPEQMTHTCHNGVLEVKLSD